MSWIVVESVVGVLGGDFFYSVGYTRGHGRIHAIVYPLTEVEQ